MQRGGREGAMYGRAILLGLGALEWEERAQHPTLWRFVTLYCIVSQTGAHPAKHALSTAFAATSTPPRKGHLQAHQTAVSDAAPRGKASPTITLHEPGAGGGGEDRQADI